MKELDTRQRSTPAQEAEQEGGSEGNPRAAVGSGQQVAGMGQAGPTGRTGGRTPPLSPSRADWRTGHGRNGGAGQEQRWEEARSESV
jgi:hypothetical protein